ncbi:hypothetical protein PFICI_15372 [Pestalotiopsis fici W106-1]|uniref:GST N-terminal domain-containing protein n=1 Tax=Pestalotiopsis fici (strain W106-1 / CGMCC3.15140) TaxID=1229662 RepID=W3WGD0_PESFW|nr:uncharacterized protein PFICI_15372 [Pestalotiopsis fici W106-1]ETS72980.1 hypothetical protein PFICI_15372 [Pestalotiopsis fici W106-1]
MAQSWTARVVLLLDFFEIPYSPRYYNIYDSASRPSDKYLEGRLVPMLQPIASDSSFIIEDSLAICEYLAEAFPDRNLWPRDDRLRAFARSAAAQMHAGFNELRNTYHTNFVARYTGDIPINDTAKKEIAKMLGIWYHARIQTKTRLAELGEKDHGFLFGSFSIADAFFWPVLWRFRSYQLPLDNITEDALQWMNTMWGHPVMLAQARGYFEQAKDAATRVDKFDDIFKHVPGVHYGHFDQDWSFKSG